MFGVVFARVTATRSLNTSNPGLLNRVWLTTTELLVNSTVWPSGGALAASAMPMLPPAPARLSMTTGCPHDSDIFCPITRAATSVGPPGANGTMKRIARVG
jgi:hypothetical protein